MHQPSYVAYGDPQPMGYVPGGPIQATPLMRLPDVTCLRCFVIVLGLLGFLQLFSIQGILALTIVCKLGCCCGSTEHMLRGLTREGCCSLNCRVVSTAIFSTLTMAGAYFGMQYLSDICGIVVTDKSNPLQAAAYTAGLAAIGVGEGAWQIAHPTASAPMDTENTAGNLAWAFVYPSDVCDFMPPLRSAGNGIYYPHPLSSFAGQIRTYLLVINGATILTAFAVCALAGKARSAYLNQSNMMITRPLAYSTMP